MPQDLTTFTITKNGDITVKQGSTGPLAGAGGSTVGVQLDQWDHIELTTDQMRLLVIAWLQHMPITGQL